MTSTIITLSVLALVACIAAAAIIKGNSRHTPPLAPFVPAPSLAKADYSTPPTDRTFTYEEQRVLLNTYRSANVKFALELGEAQRRFDRLLRLFDRQHDIDELSTAARAHEQRAIEAELAILAPPLPTRRSEA